MTQKISLLIVFNTLMTILFVGCNTADDAPPTTAPDVVQAVEPSATPLPTATNTATAVPPATSTPTPSSTPTATSTPTTEPTATATINPLANVEGQIVFSSFQAGGNPEIYVMKVNGIDLQRLTDDDYYDFAPQPSPDGEKIAFASDREEGRLQVYIMDLDGQNITRVTHSDGEDRDPAWSPDGTQLVFSSDRNGESELFIINADSSGERPLQSSNVLGYSPSWSPDGQWIAYSSNEEDGDPNVYLIAPDGTVKRRLTFSAGYDGDAPTWSPDSQWLIIPSNRIGNHELYALKMDGTEFGSVTRTEGAEFSGLLSPDGRYLLLNVFYPDYWGVILRDLEAGIDHQLTDSEAEAGYAAWIPNPQATFEEAWFVNTVSHDDDICIISEDETFGFAAENPVAIGNGPNFGGPFDGVQVYSFLRGGLDEGQEWVRMHTFPGNSKGNVLDNVLITTESGQEFMLFVNIDDYSIPQIPVGMFCDLQVP